MDKLLIQKHRGKIDVRICPHLRQNSSILYSNTVDIFSEQGAIERALGKLTGCSKTPSLIARPVTVVTAALKQLPGARHATVESCRGVMRATMRQKVTV